MASATGWPMSDGHRGGPWRGWGTGDQRPRWWPEGEPWPPTDAAPWRRMRRRLMWRMGCGLVFFVILLGSLIAFVAWLVGRFLDGSLGLLATALLPVVAFVLVVLIVIRLARGTAAPVS